MQGLAYYLDTIEAKATQKSETAMIFKFSSCNP